MMFVLIAVGLLAIISQVPPVFGRAGRIHAEDPWNLRARLQALSTRIQRRARAPAHLAEAETAGVLEPGERAMITGVMRLGDRPVRAIMAPRREVEMVDVTADQDDIRRTIVGSVHSRLPAHSGTPEEMLGVIQAKDLLDAHLRGERPDIRAQVRPAPNVPLAVR